MTGGTSITASITAWLMPHLILAPIALPLLTAGLMLLLREERQRTKVTLNITSTLAVSYTHLTLPTNREV